MSNGYRKHVNRSEDDLFLILQSNKSIQDKLDITVGNV